MVEENGVHPSTTPRFLCDACRIFLVIFLTCAGRTTLITLLLRMAQMYRRVEERHEMRVMEQRRTQLIYQQYMQQIRAANATNPMNAAELKYKTLNNRNCMHSG